MKIQRTTETLHPLLVTIVNRVQKEVILKHNIPMRLFETGRDHDRHSTLVQRGKTKDILSRHLYNLENDPPLYTTAVDYVFYDGRWSWNLRDATTKYWYVLFGHLVLDICPEMEWNGMNRKSINYCHFQLKESTINNNLDKYPCVTPR